MNELAREILGHINISQGVYKGLKISQDLYVLLDKVARDTNHSASHDYNDFVVYKDRVAWRLTESATIAVMQSHVSRSGFMLRPFGDTPLYAEMLIVKNMEIENIVSIMDTPKQLLLHLRNAIPESRDKKYMKI